MNRDIRFRIVNSILASAFEAIRRERDGDFHESFVHAENVLDDLGEAGIANRIMDAVSADVPSEDIVDLLGILCWSGTDNGAGIRRDAEQWLRDSSDERRLYVALHLEAFPFGTHQEMIEVLTKLGATYPRLRERCLELIAQRVD